MRKVALGLLLAAGVGFAAAPAHAQGFWFGIGPFGVGVGTAPYAYDYPGYYGGPVYEPYYGYTASNYYGYEPGYSYYNDSYSYAPYATYSYAPEYSYAPGYTYSRYSYAPTWGYRSYAYAPRRSVTHIYTARPRVREGTIVSSISRRHHAGVHYVSPAAMRAQASVPVHRRHTRHITIRHETR